MRNTGKAKAASALVAILLALAVNPAQAEEIADWRIPEDAPLLTRWTEQVHPNDVLPEYPRPTMVRDRWLNLNGVWDYAVTDKAQESIPAKYNGRILVPYPIESALSGVMQPLLPDQKLWYRRGIKAPEDWKEHRILLHFGAVDWQCRVFLDGRPVDDHRGGYDAFTIDLTSSLSDAKTHELVVAVTDPTRDSWNLCGKQTLHPAGASYTACSGIWQTVWMEPVPKAAVDALRVIGDPATGTLRVTVEARTPPDPTPVSIRVLDGEREVARADGVLGSEIVGGVKENLTWYKARRVWVTTTLETTIPAAKAWTPDDPFLYDVIVELKDRAGGTVDRVRSYAGLRTVSIGQDEQGIQRFFLNGSPMMLPGALDQGYWPDGVYTAPADAALRYDVEAAKQLGLVAIRKHVKVDPERYYYWCDKLGLLVLQDMPSGNQGDPFVDQPRNNEGASVCEMEMRRLIRQRGHHPSIVCWVMFNEGWGQYDTLRHAAWAKALDPTRLVDEASGFPRHGGGDIHDVHGGNPPKEKHRIGIDSETLGVGLAVEGHMWPGKLWGTGSYDPTTDGLKEGWDPTVMDDAAKR